MAIDEFLLSGDTTDLNYPEIRPTLDLNFARTKTLDPRITFARASGGTYFGPDGRLRYAGVNEPRFDHDPATGESLGLLVEEQRTNLLSRSEAISSAPWAPNGGGTTETCVPSSITDPAGGLTAFKVNLGVPTFDRWQQLVTVVSGTTYTLSAWVRATAGTQLFRLRFATGVISPNLTATTTWQRFTYTLTSATTSGSFAFTTPSTGGPAEIHVWGAQLEAGAFPTSYIPTTNATATRSADVASITGAAFSSWYQNDAITIYSEAASSSGAAYSGYIYMIGDDFNNAILHYRQVDFQPVGRVRLSGVDVYGAIGNGFIWTGASFNRFALALSAASGNQASLGALASSDDTSITMPTNIASIFLGSINGSNSFLNGTVSRLTFWPQRLPNSTLQTITL